jgi:hypothetical protein
MIDCASEFQSSLYYSSCIIVIYGNRHCIIVIRCMIDCAVGAWLRNDGFHFPGSGDE